ncbi:uncharacterized protein OCT59_000326 [Rhizophagus irregularis]|nr:hypothetical protein OCT59_000326 [Rhizophagus irregularis]
MERGSKSSYRGFLDLYHNIIVTSTFSNNWKNLDNAWATHFLEESEKLNFDQEVLKEKVSAKDFSKTSQQKDIELINFCYDILHELENKTCALPFKCIKKKDMIIKHPMDLSTINLKLKNNQYKSLEGFEKDIRLIFHNCYTYNEAGSEICYLGEVLESVFNKKWIEKITHQVKQRDELKRVRDDADIESEHWKKQCQILEENKNNVVYRQFVDNAFLIASAYESLIEGNIIPFIKTLKTFLLTRSRMSLSSTNEPVIQAIIENFLPLKYCIPELALVINGKKPKGSGRFGFSDIFVLGKTGVNNISLELKCISLIGLIENQVNNFNANELEILDKMLEKEDEESLLKRTYVYWSNSSGVFDERVKITKSDPNKLKGFVILVIGFHRILWRPVEEIITNYTYNKI